MISAAWSNGRDDAAVQKMTSNVVHRVEAAAKNLGVENRYLYINYASAAQADAVFAGYGDRNVQRLQEVQRTVVSLPPRAYGRGLSSCNNATADSCDN